MFFVLLTLFTSTGMERGCINVRVEGGSFKREEMDAKHGKEKNESRFPIISGTGRIET